MKKMIDVALRKQSQIIICVVLYLFVCMTIYTLEQQPRISIKILYEFGLEEDTHGLMSVIKHGNIERQIGACVDQNARKKYEMQFSLDAGVIPENMIIDLQYGVQETRIKAIEVYDRVIQVRRFDPLEIPFYFDCQEGESYDLESPFIVFHTEDDSPTIIGNDKLYEELQKVISQNSRLKWNLYFWCSALEIFAIWVIVCREKILLYIKLAKNFVLERYIYILIAMLFIVFFMVAKVAIQSDNYAHPDENVVRQAIDYYLGGWFRPLVSSNWTAGTFSEYGITRLEERSWYYLAAGKIGWLVAQIFHSFSYYRMLNLFLFFILSVLAVRYREKESWLLSVLLFTPQLWYVFSYATSDGWDVFWSIIVVIQLCKKDSILNQYLEDRSQHNILPVFLIGTLFAFIFEGKTNYYLILLVAFLDLLFRLFGKSRSEMYGLIKKYVFILLMTAAMFVLKTKLDDVAYFIPQDIHQIETNGYNFDLDAPEAMGINNDLQGQGMGIQEYIDKLHEYQFFKVLFESFCGLYGWMAYRGTDGYYRYMLILYLIVHICVIYHSVRYQSWKEKILTFSMMGFYLLEIGAVVYNGYVNDLQIQGRYLLPMVAIMGYLCSKSKHLQTNKVYKISMMLLALGGIYSYAVVCMKFVM